MANLEKIKISTAFLLMEEVWVGALKQTCFKEEKKELYANAGYKEDSK